jgi:hypothetical protein
MAETVSDSNETRTYLSDAKAELLDAQSAFDQLNMQLGSAVTRLATAEEAYQVALFDDHVVNGTPFYPATDAANQSRLFADVSIPTVRVGVE